VIYFMLSCFGSFTGDSHPIYNAPMLGAHKAMDRITMPSALLSRILLPQDPRQKQVVIGHRGRWQQI
jgi:hypothetical protein